MKWQCNELDLLTRAGRVCSVQYYTTTSIWFTLHLLHLITAHSFREKQLASMAMNSSSSLQQEDEYNLQLTAPGGLLHLLQRTVQADANINNKKGKAM